MTAHLLILYPIPKDAAEFDRAYREEHLPYAGPRLVGATSVKTQRVVGPGFAPPPYHLMSDVSFQTLSHESLRGIREWQGGLGACCLDQFRRRANAHRHDRRCLDEARLVDDGSAPGASPSAATHTRWHRQMRQLKLKWKVIET